MIKMAVFDIDNTLAFVGRPILEKNVELLKRIEDSGVKIAISSGKSIFYQIGMFRQVDLKSPILIGENGCSIAFGIDLPPKLLETVKPTAEYFVSKAEILAHMNGEFPNGFWLQPNEVMLTLFFKDDRIRDGMRAFFGSHEFSDVIVYEHVDSFDVVPASIDKYVSLEKLCEHLNIGSGEVIVIGDGVNDIPMFRFCKLSIGVYGLDKNLTTYHFNDITKALEFILEEVNK